MTEEKLEIELPSNLKLRKQNPKCNEKGHLCATLNDCLICLEPILKENEKKEFTVFDVKPCQFNKDKKIKVTD